MKRARILSAFATLFAVGSFLIACDDKPKTGKPPVAGSETTNSIIDDGRRIAESQCASCHAVGTSGESPNPKAPVFRTVLARYSPGALAEDLREGMRIGHPDMPIIQIEPSGVDALMMYLASIQEHRADAVPKHQSMPRSG